MQSTARSVALLEIWLPEFLARLLEAAADTSVPLGLLGSLPLLRGCRSTYFALERAAVAVDKVVMEEIVARLLG